MTARGGRARPYLEHVYTRPLAHKVEAIIVLTRLSRPWLTRRTLVCVAARLGLVGLLGGQPSAQSTPEGPSTRDGAWTLVSFPPLTFPPSKVPEAEALSVAAARTLSQGRSAEAIGMWEKAIALDPAHPFAYWRMGSLSSDAAKASELMHRQIAMAPSPPAYLHGAFSLQLRGRSDEALAIWREGTRRYPDDRNMAALFGEHLLTVGLVEEAVAILEEETKRRPDSSRLRLHLGRAFIAAGDPEAGLTELRAAARLEDTVLMWRAQANILATTRLDLDASLQFARRAVAAAEAENSDLEPGAPSGIVLNATIRLFRAWDVLSLAHASRGEVAAARSFGQAAWRLSPNADSLLRIGTLSEAAGDTQAAAADYARSWLFAGPDAATHAARLRRLVSPADAAAYLEQARRWDQQERVMALTVTPPVPTRASLTIQTDRQGQVLSVRSSDTSSTDLAPLLARIREATLPRMLPSGSSLDRIRLQWVMTCEADGTCRLWPYSVPRGSPFEPF